MPIRRRLARWSKRLAIGLLTLSVAVLAYCGIVVWRARARTPALVREALASPSIQLQAKELLPWQRRALLAVEDPGFYSHHGVDLRTPGGGITTLSQSVVKGLYFERFQPGLAKIPQTLIARFAFDPLVAKEDQITLFVNQVYLGSHGGKPVVGFAAAARAYFGKAVPELTEDEFLALVAMPIRPTEFHLLDYPERNANRVAAIKRLLSGAYRPRGLMDLYYGGETYRPSRGPIRDWWTEIVWGY
jgi:hypothetical protein